MLYTHCSFSFMKDKPFWGISAGVPIKEKNVWSSSPVLQLLDEYTGLLKWPLHISVALWKKGCGLFSYLRLKSSEGSDSTEFTDESVHVSSSYKEQDRMVLLRLAVCVLLTATGRSSRFSLMPNLYQMLITAHLPLCICRPRLVITLLIMSFPLAQSLAQNMNVYISLIYDGVHVRLHRSLICELYFELQPTCGSSANSYSKQYGDISLH